VSALYGHGSLCGLHTSQWRAALNPLRRGGIQVVVFGGGSADIGRMFNLVQLDRLQAMRTARRMGCRSIAMRPCHSFGISSASHALKVSNRVAGGS
jgi:hypothetical protein